jgi:polygalacturonase
MRFARVSLITCFSVASHFAMSAPECDPKTFGAKADGRSKDTRALQAAIDSCAATGGLVELRSGTYVTGPIVLRTHTTLKIDRGARLLGSPDPGDYPEIDVFRERDRQALISAHEASDIAIKGEGTIDGNGAPWWDMIRQQKAAHKTKRVERPRLLVFDHCRNIRLEGVTFQNSPSWQIVPYYSEEVVIREVKILAPADSPNTDGIDPFSSSRVTIDHAVIDVGDDNVAIKSGQPNSPGPDDPSTDIVISDCTFLHGHGLSVGSEISGGVQNVRVARIRFRDTDNGVRVKSNRDRGGDIGKFEFRDISMEGVKTAILISEYYPKIPQKDAPEAVKRLTPRFHDITITNLQASGSNIAGLIVGLPESPIQSVRLNNVHITAEKGFTIANATVLANDFVVEALRDMPFHMLENAKINQLRKP